MSIDIFKKYQGVNTVTVKYICILIFFEVLNTRKNKTAGNVQNSIATYFVTINLLSEILKSFRELGVMIIYLPTSRGGNKRFFSFKVHLLCNKNIKPILVGNYGLICTSFASHRKILFTFVRNESLRFLKLLNNHENN